MAWTLIASDDFNRNSSPAVGNGWQERVGTAAYTNGSGDLLATTDTACLWETQDAGSNNQKSRARTQATEAKHYFGIGLRGYYDGSGLDCYIINYLANDDTTGPYQHNVRMYKCTNGSFSQVGSGYVGAEYNFIGLSKQQMWCTAVGTSFELGYADNLGNESSFSTPATWTDSTYDGSTQRYGVAYVTGAGGYNNFGDFWFYGEPGGKGPIMFDHYFKMMGA